MDLRLAIAIYGAGLLTGIVTFAIAMWGATNDDDAPLSKEEQNEIEMIDRGDHQAFRRRFT
jgi:hypothetical protein